MLTLTELHAMDGMVRVYLSSLGQRSRVDVTVCGSYSLDGTAATAIRRTSSSSRRFGKT